MKIAIVDTVGLMYDGETIFKKGLGGSESAIILMSRELVKLGFSVVVYNKCQGTVSKPGIYEGVEYRTYDNLPEETFDILISSRSILPFVPDKPTFDQFDRPYTWELAQRLQKSTYKVLWMHDTFCNGDHLVEPLLLHGHINEIFTLSDFHTHYVTWLDHGHPRRNFEVLKNKVFQTRNGMLRVKDFVDVKNKDYNLFVYNSSITKGMIPLVTRIWPEIKKHIPQAKLKVIGGFYRFNDEGASDKAEQDWHNLRKEYEAKNLDIEFTGVIPQTEIFDILEKASWLIYPSAFPETFGISMLEALAHNVPILGCRFGAMEETAIENSSYLIDYAIEPNGLWPAINTDDQCNKFTHMVLQAYNTPYLWQQKSYNCNNVKDICTWDTVALQWKQHFYNKLNVYMPVDEYRKVQQINTKVHKVFGRRFTNKEEIVYQKKDEQKITCIVPFYNNELYIARCIFSIASQDYDNYTVHLIDDASTDNTKKVIDMILDSLPENIKQKFIYTKRDTNMGAVFNQINTIRELPNNDIIMLIDGDDALAPKSDIFTMYNNLFLDGTEYSYGSMWSLVDNIPLIAQPYPPEIAMNKSYRQYKFNWNMPYTHLRAFRKYLINNVPDSGFQDENGHWYRAGGDNSTFYNILEQADPTKVEVVSDIVYLYNDCNVLNDYKVNAEEQNKTAEKILNRTINQETIIENKFSVIVPTMWKVNHLFLPFLKVLYDHPLVGEVLLFNNNKEITPDYPKHSKLTVFDFGKNLFVNPAWNMGAAESKYNLLCFLNDDVVFDTKVFEKLLKVLTPEAGVFGLNPGVSDFNQKPVTNNNIEFDEYVGQHTYGFGCLFFIHKESWKPIPDGLNIYYGDDYIFNYQIHKGKKNYFISNMTHYTPFAATTSDTSLTGGVLEKESETFTKVTYNE
jgi:glycosyltransferase involved in cell wall biosynthesis